MTAPVIIGNATLYLGSCEDILPTLPKVDAVVTSPPYDNLRSYNDPTFSWSRQKWGPIISKLYCSVKDGGVVVWIVADATSNGSETGTSFRQALHAMDCGFRLHDTMIWEKPDYKPLTHKRYEQSFEYMFVWSKGAPKTFNGIKDKPNVGAGRSVTGTWRDVDGSTKPMSGANVKAIADFGLRPNIWKASTAKGVRKDNHPAPFPLGLCSDHVLSWSNEADTILDPFMGSGTTGVAALQMGRKFIGIEREPKYFEAACRRLRETCGEDVGPLFSEQAA